MIRGLPASLALHALVIFGGVTVFPHVDRGPPEEPVVVPIELVTIASVTDLAPIVEPDEPVEDPAPEPPPIEEYLEDLDVPPDDAPPAEAEAPPPPPEAAENTPPAETEAPEEAPPPEPDPEPAEAPKPEEKAPAKTPPPKPKQEAPPEPEAEEVDLAELSSLFDRARKTPERAPPKTPERTETPDRPALERRGAGARTANTARIEAIIVSQMKRCWADVVDLPDPQRLQVRVRVRLRPDGRLAEDVELLSPSRAAVIGDRYYRTAIDRALTATRKCAPYQLPSDEYDEWKEVIMNIGPETS